MMDGQAEECSLCHHGRKRRANDNYESDQRLAKRFNLLNLGQNSKFYNSGSQIESPHSTGRESGEIESMQIDDTKEKVYIYNLDQEIAEIESEEGKLVFLPDIEKKFGKIPRSVLTTKSQPVTSSEMILYNVPSSLSVPREQDNVRRAIIETRARASDKRTQDIGRPQLTTSGAAISIQPILQSNENLNVHMDELETDDDDENAMDIG